MTSAEEREAAWLSSTGDGLPSLPASDGGPWDVIQAWQPGSKLNYSLSGIYVWSRPVIDDRVSSQRIMPRNDIQLYCLWPVKNPVVPLAETAQEALKQATILLLLRVRGPVGDKSHGGRFLSVAESVRPQAMLDNPQQTITKEGCLRQVVTYRADDYEVTG
jgi:hypothetical protein